MPPLGSKPGLQPERTSLAWHRTALTGMALLGTVAKVAADQHSVLAVVCAVVVLANGVTAVVCGRLRARSRTYASSHRLHLVFASTTVAACVAAAVSLAPSW